MLHEIIRTKFLTFFQTKKPDDTRKTYVYAVMSGLEAVHQLGQIAWFPQWRRYTYQTAKEHIILDKVCMQQIIELIDNLESDRLERKDNG